MSATSECDRVRILILTAARETMLLSAELLQNNDGNRAGQLMKAVEPLRAAGQEAYRAGHLGWEPFPPSW